MINISLSSLRNSTNFFDIDDIATIVNGRKKEEVGFFVPKIYKKEFEEFSKELEKKRKKDILQRVAKASKKDPIEDGAIDDGIN
jgi:Mg/Co/Ni transporter MgtE